MLYTSLEKWMNEFGKGGVILEIGQLSLEMGSASLDMGSVIWEMV